MLFRSLTPAQVARTLIVLPAMERRIQNQLRKVTQKPGKGRSPGAANGGELGPDPFGDTLRNPFDDRKAGAKKPTAPRASEPCDPFTNVHGCRK